MHWINTYLATVLVQTRSVTGVQESLQAVMSSGEARVGLSSRGWVEIELTLEARSVAHASTMAASLARRATGADPIACHVITRSEHAAPVAAAARPSAVGQVSSPRDTAAKVPNPRQPA